ncbi:hypothetical protein IAD21_02208 [Abditibacteriota bacterium]|nr:hypothetical protein IAD21_02208 [Abditibacteriota bacterium]
MNSSFFRRSLYYEGKGQHKFRTRFGNFEEMCDMLRAVAHAEAEIWFQTERLEIELRTVFLNRTLQVSFCSNAVGEAVTLSPRERTLMGYITRFYAARPHEFVDEQEAEKKSASAFSINRGNDWSKNNPYFILKVEAPSMHEKMEAMVILRDWLRQYWPDGEKHLARVV